MASPPRLASILIFKNMTPLHSQIGKSPQLHLFRGFLKLGVVGTDLTKDLETELLSLLGWWQVVLVLRRQRKEDYKFKVSLGCIVSHVSK